MRRADGRCPRGWRPSAASTFQLTGRPARSDIGVISSTSSSVKPLRHPGTIISTVVPGWPATTAASRSSSSRLADRDGTGLPSPSLWVGAWEVEKPSAPSASARCSSSSSRSSWSAVASPPTAVVAHDRPAQRGVADQEAGVDPDRAVEAGQPLAEGGPRPVEPGLEGGERHPLHPGHHPGEVVGVLRTGRREREPAVPSRTPW